MEMKALRMTYIFCVTDGQNANPYCIRQWES